MVVDKIFDTLLPQIKIKNWLFNLTGNPEPVKVANVPPFVPVFDGLIELISREIEI